MAFAEPTLADVERRAALTRTALCASLADISNRLRPANLVAAAKHEIAFKVSAAAGNFGEAIRKHGGEAALFGAGTLLAFDMGRKTTQRRDPPSIAEAMSNGAGHETNYMQFSTWKPSSTSSHMTHGIRDLVDKTRSWVAPLAGVALGYVVAGALPKTRIETEAFGTFGKEFRDTIAEFQSKHAQGAKQVAAQALGIANLTAAALGLMAALGKYFSSPAGQDGNTGPAERAANPSAHYDTPDDVLRDPGMSRDQCAKALDQMELDARLLQTAEDEGMGGGEPTRIAEVSETKAQVGVPPLPKPV